MKHAILILSSLLLALFLFAPQAGAEAPTVESQPELTEFAWAVPFWLEADFAGGVPGLLCQNIPCVTTFDCRDNCPRVGHALCRNGLCAYGF